MQNSILKSSRQAHFLYALTDLMLAMVIFYTVYILRYNLRGAPFVNIDLPNLQEYTFTFALWLIFIFIFFAKDNLYATNRGISIPEEISRVLANLLYSGILAGAVIFFAQYKFFSRLVFLSSFLLLCVFLSGWRAIKRLILRKMIARGFRNINFLIVGAGALGKIAYEEIERNPWLGFRVAGFLDNNVKDMPQAPPVLGRLADFQAIVKKYFIDQVIITAGPDRELVLDLIEEAKDMHLGVSVIPEVFDESLPLLNMSYLGSLPLLNYKERAAHPAELALKSVFDIIASLFFLIILSWLFALIALLIKLGSRGPVFYVQQRVGAKGKIFSFYKFRSMVKDAEKMKGALLGRNEVKDGIIFKIKDDPRITSIGKFLRKTSLDELPQLINVIKGDMSLVGPRPPTPDEVEKYHYNHMQRLSIKPGITGLSQIRGRSELTFRKWVKWDLWYVNNWSFGLDLKILLLTIPAVLKGRGAY